MEGDVSPSMWGQLSALGHPKAGSWSSGGSSTFGVLWRKLLLPCGASRSLSSFPSPLFPP